MPQTLVTYHYYEKDSSYRDNLIHFLSFGYSKEADYIIIIAGDHTLDLPKANNISYIFTENLNNDFGGYCYVINNAIDIHQYEFFFFINSSVRGPFLTIRDKKPWTEYFIEQLEPDTGIIGSTINILPANSFCATSYVQVYGEAINYSHVQTTSYLLPKKSLLHLLKEGFYDTSGIPDKEEAIRDYELRLSQLIKNQGWNLKCLLPEYNKIDYRLPHEEINPTSDKGDACFKDSYFGRTVNPNEIIFIKTNRNIYPLAYLERLAYSLFSIGQSKEQVLKSDHLKEYRSRIGLVNTRSERLSYLPLSQAYRLLIKRTIRKLKGKEL